MTLDPTNTTIGRYLRAEISVEEAAESLMASGGGHPGFGIDLHGMDAGQLERVDALMGRLMWLVLRAQNPGAAPDQPFDAAAWRARREEMERLMGDPGSTEPS
jgi:hypothetical protein